MPFGRTWPFVQDEEVIGLPFSPLYVTLRTFRSVSYMLLSCVRFSRSYVLDVKDPVGVSLYR